MLHIVYPHPIIERLPMEIKCLATWSEYSESLLVKHVLINQNHIGNNNNNCNLSLQVILGNSRRDNFGL